MFSPEDHWVMLNIATALEQAGFPTYLPQRDGIETGKAMDVLNSPAAGTMTMLQFAMAMRSLQRAAFTLDMYHLHKTCGAVVFNMNGRVPDEGSTMEASSAFTAGMPLVVYKQTLVSELAGFDNAMIAGLEYDWVFVETVEAIPAAIGKAIDTFPPSPYSGECIPQHMQKMIVFGEMVAALNDELKPKDIPIIEKLLKIADYVQKNFPKLR
jgi:hypothetical protein